MRGRRAGEPWSDCPAGGWRSMDDPRVLRKASSPGGGSEGGLPDSLAVEDGLARLLTAASIYPPTHRRIVEIAEPVLAALRRVAATRPLVIRVDGDGTDRPVPARVERLRRD